MDAPEDCADRENRKDAEQEEYRAIDWLTETLLQASSRDEAMTPASTMLLLRRYVETGREDLREAVGDLLARAMDMATSSEERDRRPDWLALFTEAVAVSEDERLRAVCQTLVVGLSGEWPGAPGANDIEPAMRAIDSCLTAVNVVAGSDDSNRLMSAAIDELERVAGRAYTPGAGIGGTLGDHVSAASALMTAYQLTGRLPYSMLAEELIQFARRTWWDDDQGTWLPAPGTEHRALSTALSTAPSTQHPAPGTLFVLTCEAARVLCRLALLHRDGDYRQAAVLSDCDYGADAGRALASLRSQYQSQGATAGVYGLALQEWLDLQ